MNRLLGRHIKIFVRWRERGLWRLDIRYTIDVDRRIPKILEQGLCWLARKT